MVNRAYLPWVGAVAIAAFLLSLLPCAAQSTATAARDNDTELLMLGTAGGPPLRAERSEPATLLVVDGRAYLIDCGIGTIRRLVEAGIPSETIGTIFFTHLHPDHTLGLVDVMSNDYFHLDLAHDARKIDIYGPRHTAELVDTAFHFLSIPFAVFAAEKPGFHPELPNSGLKSPFVAHEFEREGVVYHDDKIEVTAVENSHYALMPAELRASFHSYSFRIQTPHGVVVFTGDTGPSDAVAKLAKGADVLVVEVEGDAPELLRFVDHMAEQNHWTPQRKQQFIAHMTSEHLDVDHVGELAAKAQVKAVVFYHYDPDGKAEQAAYVAGVRKQFHGPVFAPSDLDRYCLAGANGHAKFDLCGK